MPGTWLSSAMAEKARRARYAFLACLVGGLIQKPLIKFAWDVQAFQEQLQRVYEAWRIRGGGVALLGGTAILLRQVFATVGQAAVGDIGTALAVAGKCWDKASMRQLLQSLGRLLPADRMKRKGRMAAYSGPTWIRKVTATAGTLKRFDAAAEALGSFLTASSVSPSAFHELCATLKGPAKLVNVSQYSVPHLVRACCVGRAFIRGDGVDSAVQPDADAWASDLRVMHRDRTKGIFDLLNVRDYHDACAMRGTIYFLAKHVWSSSVARHYSSISLVDLPCCACEFGGVLGAVDSIHGGGDAGAVRWLLRHLPGGLAKLKTMGLLLKQDVARVEGRGDGNDRQAAGTITRGWLKGAPAAPASTMETIFNRGGGDTVFGIPAVLCPECDGHMEVRVLGRKRASCDECYHARVRATDAARQARRRRLA